MEGKGRDDLVFAAPAGGVLRIATFRTRVFNKAVDKLRGLDDDGNPATDWPRPTMHDLRRTSGVSGHLGGREPEGLQNMLGHKSAALTLDTYTTYSPTI